MASPNDLQPRDPRAPGRRAVLGSATAIRGQIAAREDLWVDGQFEGEIHAAGQQLTVSPGGRVRGQVRARSVIVEGELYGEVDAEQQVVVRSGGRIRGDVRSPRVGLEDGCAFDGTVDMEPAPARSGAAAAERDAATPQPAAEPDAADPQGGSAREGAAAGAAPGQRQGQGQG